MKWQVPLLLTLGVGMLAASEEQPDASLDVGRELIDQNRTCSIDVPNDWSPVFDPTGRSVISVGNLVRGEYLSVSVVDKDDFEGSLADVMNQSISGIVVHMENHTQGEPVDCEIGGIPAQQTRITGTQDRFRYIYTLTVAESKTHFYRILTFTKPSTEQEASGVFAKVLSTFKPLESRS
jgi:hypothetical protein